MALALAGAESTSGLLSDVFDGVFLIASAGLGLVWWRYVRHGKQDQPALLPSEGDGPYELWLIESGTKKIEVIKTVRSLTGADLRSAKDLVDSAPALIAGNLDEDLADQAATLLRTAGAQASVETVGSDRAESPPAPRWH